MDRGLPLSSRRVILTLIPKKGDFQDTRNSCPICLHYMVYKVVVKVISLHLKSMLENVVHPNLTYVVPGRIIFNNLYRVCDLLELTHQVGLSFTFLSLDLKKFDRVEHGYFTELWVPHRLQSPLCAVSMGAIHHCRVCGQTQLGADIAHPVWAGSASRLTIVRQALCHYP